MMSCHRTDESRVDCMMQAGEVGYTYDGCTDIGHQHFALKRLVELGLIEPGEPHPWANLVGLANDLLEALEEIERLTIRNEATTVEGQTH